MSKLKMVINVRVEIDLPEFDANAFRKMTGHQKQDRIRFMQENTKNHFKENVDTEAKIVSEHVDINIFESQDE